MATESFGSDVDFANVQAKFRQIIYDKEASGDSIKLGLENEVNSLIETRLVPSEAYESQFKGIVDRLFDLMLEVFEAYEADMAALTSEILRGLLERENIKQSVRWQKYRLYQEIQG